MTHAELVKLAAAWLEKRCPIVVTEMSSWAVEIPDAIGFGGTVVSILVECKASRADFLRDRAKPHRRRPEKGLGRVRYFLAPEGVIKPDELPPMWGLIEAKTDGALRVKVKAQTQARNAEGEQYLLMSCLRRIGAHVPEGEGVSVKTYTIKTKRTATLGIAPEEERTA